MKSLPKQSQAQQRPRPLVTSPEVLADGRIIFRIDAVEAERVELGSVGDIPGVGSGQIGAMIRDQNGVWELTVGPVPPGAYRYAFTVDGVTMMDPRNPRTSESNDHAWSLVDVPGAAWMDLRDVPHGAVSELHYWSSALNRFRRLHVYTPPGYEAGNGCYPILYLLHGAYDSDDSWSTVGRAGIILDNLIADGRAKPMVVVMPHGHTASFEMGDPMFGDFERDFLTDIQPQMERRYRVRTDRAGRAMAGLSMGGAHTLNIGIPQMAGFAYLGVFSSGVFGIAEGVGDGPGIGFEQEHAAVLDDPRRREGLKLFWFATGREDFLVETSRATVAMFRKHGFDVVYVETEGAHRWDKWREYLREFASQLFH